MAEVPGRVLLVEDDHLQSEMAVEALHASLPDTRITVIRTEHEFRTKFPGIVSNPPDLVVMDVLLNWSYDFNNYPVKPEEVERGKVYTAGLRCQRLLARHPATENTQVLLWSIADIDKRSNLLRDYPDTENAFFLLKRSTLASDFATEVGSFLMSGLPIQAVRLSAQPVITK